MRIKVTVTQPVAPESEVFMSSSAEVLIHPGYVTPSWLKPSGIAVTEALDDQARSAFMRDWRKACLDPRSPG
jgi:hypothetical protein